MKKTLAILLACLLLAAMLPVALAEEADLNQAMMDVLAGVASGMMSAEDGCAYLAEVQAEQ